MRRFSSEQYGEPSRRRWLAGVACLTLVTARAIAQDEEFDLTLEGILEQTDEFLKENLHDGELTLPEPDPVQLDEFLRSLQAQLEGEYVLDLGPFKRTVDFLLPLLESHEALREIGAWLRARRDYFDVIDELTLIVPSPPPPATNAPGATPAGVGLTRPLPPGLDRVETGRTTNEIPRAGVLTNRVSVEVVNRDDEEEPGPINVVVVPTPTVPTRPPTGGPPATNRLVAVAPAPRPPASPSFRRENPAPEAVRSVWAHQLAGRDWPAGARQWVPKLKPIFVAEGVPAELVWLAEVESGFDPRARSPAGAVGLYQLMPVTARSLGLSSFPLDQRKSPEKSSRAAAQYLRQLYGQFGDWPLALAAYNAGPTRVRSLLTAHGASTFGGIARRLPVETQLYVPKFDAVLHLREGRGLKDLWPAVVVKDPAANEGPLTNP